MARSIDEQLIILLGQDARQSSETLAKQLNISSATVRRRLRRLLKNDLLRIIGVVDPTKFGYSVHVVITIDVEHDKIDSAMESLIALPEIKYASTTTGHADILVVAQFASTNRLSDFLLKTLGLIDGVKNSETLLCLDVRKGRYVPLYALEKPSR